MNILRIGILVAALIVAGLVAYLVNSFLAQQTAVDEVPVKEESLEVLVAAKNLPAGQALLVGELEGDLRWQVWPESAIDPEQTRGWIIYDPERESSRNEVRKEIADSVVIRGFVVGEPIDKARLILKDETGKRSRFMPAALQPGMRAVSIPIKASTAASGFVVPGSRVDIIVTKRWQEPNPVTGQTQTRFVSETFLENVRVLAIDAKVDDLVDNMAGKTATIEVTPKQAEKLAVIQSLVDRLSLSLRSLTDGEETAPADPFTSELEVSKFLSRDTGNVSPILVARRKLEPGTLLTDVDHRWVTPPKGMPLQGLLVRGRFNAAAIRGALLTETVEPGEPLREETLISPGTQGFITAALRPGMRAVSVAVTAVSGVSGFISPGDLVDVVLTQAITDPGDDAPLSPRRFSETILRNARVLAIEQQIDESTGKPEIGQTATLELDPKQSESVILAATMGSLSLVLKGYQEEPRRAGRPFTSDLEISRAAWELIRGFNRFGPGLPPEPLTAEAPPPPPSSAEEEVAGKPKFVPASPPPKKAAAPTPAPPPAPAPSPVPTMTSRRTITIFSGGNASSVTVKR